MCIVDTIRIAAKAKGISLAALERALGFGNGTIGKWKKQSPSFDRVQAVAEFLEVSIDFLISGKERPKLGSSDFSADEKELLALYNSLDAARKARALERLTVLAEQCAVEALKTTDPADG